MMAEHNELVDGLVARLAVQAERDHAHGRAARHERMRAAIVARLEEEQAPTRTWQIGGMVVALAAAVLLAWAWWPVAQTYRIGPGAGGNASAAFIVADDDEPVTVTFSGGSTVKLQPRARLRVGERRTDGADLELGEGTIVARLEQPGSWRLEAGPYRMVMLGAEATVRWSAEDGAFELLADRGRVEVRGPGIDGTRVLDEGERLVVPAGADVAAMRDEPAAVDIDIDADVDDVDIDDDAYDQDEGAEVDEDRADGGSATASQRRGEARERRGSARSRKVSKPEPADAPTPTVQPRGDDWRALARRSEYRAAMEAAEAAGFEALTTSLDAEGLLQLGDVCRYAHQPRRAREVLTTLRRRFPDTDAAAAAAFDLGRLAAGSSCTAATKWFRTYLDERPGGSMASAAIERIDECNAAEVDDRP